MAKKMVITHTSRTSIIVVITVMLLSVLSGCTAPVSEPTTTDVPTVTLTPTAKPRPTPVPTPTATPELFTEEEKEYLEYIDYLGFYFYDDEKNIAFKNNDMYCILLLEDAFNKGKLDNIINENRLTNEQVDLIVSSTELLKWFYTIENDLFLENQPKELDCSGGEAFIRIIRGDSIKLSYHALNNVQTSLQGQILNNFYPLCANPKESREDIEELIKLYDEAVETKTVDQFDKRMNSEDYTILEKWQVIEYVLLYGSGDINWDSPTISYQGQEMLFVEYALYSGLVERIHNELEDFLTTNYLRESEKHRAKELEIQ